MADSLYDYLLLFINISRIDETKICLKYGLLDENCDIFLMQRNFAENTYDSRRRYVYGIS